MQHDEQLVFVEVRHRTVSSFVRAALTVDARKQRKLAAAAAMFLARYRSFRNCTCRFDVVGIDSDGDETVIEWLQDAFRPGL